MPREWNSSSYDRISRPQVEMGTAVLERLELRGDELVIDAGCGTGRLTEMLVERLPHGHVLAVDGSAAMLERARERLGDRVAYLHSDLLELEVDELFDGVFSTATFHWVEDHVRLFERLRFVLVPGGWLVAQCGGQGNVAAFYALAEEVAGAPRFSGAFADWSLPKRFAGAQETETLLERAGFREAHCWLSDAPVVLDDPDEFMRTVLLGAHLDRLDPQDQEMFVAAVASRIDRPLRLDYVRLNIEARA